MKRTFFLLAIILQCIAPLATADIIKAVEGKSLKTARGFDIEAKLRNDDVKFGVRVTVDHADRVYKKGELMKVTVTSAESGYLYLIYKQADGTTKCLFPNLHESDNWIKGKTPITIPTDKQAFNLRCNAPFGDELLTAIVSKQRLDPEKQFGTKSLTEDEATDVSLETLVRSIKKGMTIEGRLPAVDPSQWAEHSVSTKSVAKRDATPQRKKIGLFIGISKYKDGKIRPLHICHLDAKVMAIAMKEHGKLNGIGVLFDKEATRSNIEKAFRELKLKSNPGDEIVIYWSGHGGRMADTDGDETTDSVDEFLVPYDADTEEINDTTISDDALGRWIQELDGRKVTVIFDACHCGGAAENKSVESGSKDLEAENNALDSEEDMDSLLHRARQADNGSIKSFSRFQIGGAMPRKDGHSFMWDAQARIQNLGTKDIRAQDAAMLLSCKAGETSAERRDGKLSVMTHFLVKKIITSDSLTLKEAYDYIKVEVPKYMKEYYPNHPQTPQLLPEDGANVKLK